MWIFWLSSLGWLTGWVSLWCWAGLNSVRWEMSRFRRNVARCGGEGSPDAAAANSWRWRYFSQHRGLLLWLPACSQTGTHAKLSFWDWQMIYPWFSSSTCCVFVFFSFQLSMSSRKATWRYGSITGSYLSCMSVNRAGRFFQFYRLIWILCFK